MTRQFINADGYSIYRGKPTDDKASRILSAGGVEVTPLPPVSPGPEYIWDGTDWTHSPSADQLAEQKATSRSQAIRAVAKRRDEVDLALAVALRAIYLALPPNQRPTIPQRALDILNGLRDVATNPDLKPGDEP